MRASRRLLALCLLAACSGSSAGTVTATTPVTPKDPTPTPTPVLPESTTASVPGFLPNVPVIALNVIAARPTNSSVALSLLSGLERDATVTLLSDGRTFTTHLFANTAATVEVTGLAADRAYGYRVSAGTTTIPGTFRTARALGTTWRFTMQADSHLDTGTDPKIYANTLANVVADSSDFFVDLGDTFMSDKLTNYQDAAPMYYAQRYYFGLVGASTPAYLVQGNHDAESAWLPANAAWAAQMRSKYFTSVAPNAFYSSAPARNYYAWTWGDATFIALDPYGFTTPKPNGANAGWTWTLGKEQYDWLAATLQKTTSKYTFVFLHHLIGGNGSEARGGSEASSSFEWGGKNLDGSAGFTTQRSGWAKPIHDLLVQYKVSAVFHGHDHLYVHQERDGIAYQEVPQPSFAREGATQSAADYGYLSGTLASSSGHIRVTISPSKARVEYVRSRLAAGNGGIVDAYDILPAVRP
jgi:3',5'-cyclic AMP phosphodiesterase CpdA